MDVHQQKSEAGENLQDVEYLQEDPLQYELERIRKEADNISTTHQDMKLQMRLDCEKEMEEIRKKYEIKVQELEAVAKELDANYNKVLMNKILADVFRSKCMDFGDSATPGNYH